MRVNSQNQKKYLVLVICKTCATTLENLHKGSMVLALKLTE